MKSSLTDVVRTTSGLCRQQRSNIRMRAGLERICRARQQASQLRLFWICDCSSSPSALGRPAATMDTLFECSSWYTALRMQLKAATAYSLPPLSIPSSDTCNGRTNPNASLLRRHRVPPSCLGVRLMTVLSCNHRLTSQLSQLLLQAQESRPERKLYKPYARII